MFHTVGSGANSRPPSSAKSTPTKRMRLVSYGADDDGGGGGDTSLNAGAEEDGDTDDTRQQQQPQPEEAAGKGSGSDMDLDTGEEEDGEEEGGKGGKGGQQLQTQESMSTQVDAWDHGSQLPPEPEGMCNPALQKHITEMWNRRKETGYDMNAVIQNKKMFRNPSIYEKLIQACFSISLTHVTLVKS